MDQLAPDRRERWQTAVDVLTVAGSLVLGLYAIGGVIVALRLSALKLPIDAAVATLPKNALLVVSVRALAPGLFAASVIWWLTRSRRSGVASRRARFVDMALMLGGVAAVALVHVALEQPVRSELAAGSAIVMLAVVVGGLAVLRRQPGRPRLDLALLMVVAALALSAATEAIPPTRLDYVTVRLKDGGVTDGHYLASDGGSLYLAPNVLERTVGDISVIPRGEVKSFKVERYPEQARRVEGWREQTAGLVAGNERVYDLLTGIRIDPGWVYPPMVPYVAAQFLLGQEEFLDGMPHDWGGGEIVAEPVGLEDMLVDPQLYTEKVIRTRGLVTRVTDVEPGRRLVVVRAARGDRGHEAYCEYQAAGPDGIEAETRVRLRAIVLAWGTYQTRSGTPANVTALACAHVSRLGARRLP